MVSGRFAVAKAHVVGLNSCSMLRFPPGIINSTNLRFI